VRMAEVSRGGGSGCVTFQAAGVSTGRRGHMIVVTSREHVREPARLQ